MNNQSVLTSMIIAIKEASTIIKNDFEKASNGQHLNRVNKNYKNGLPDFATETDQKSEQAIQASLASSQPEIPFVGEECGGDLNQEHFFLVDPLDGTSNFASLRDYFCVCAAYIKNHEVVAAVIANPMNGDIVYASKGCGTFLNGDIVDLSQFDEQDLKQTQLECEVPFFNKNDFSLVSKIIPSMSGMRKSGSTALDILNIIKGRNIICLSSGLEPHDIAPCGLIISEAGGLASELPGEKIKISSRTLIAGPRNKYRIALNLMNSP